MGTETKVTKKAKKLGQKVLDDKFEMMHNLRDGGKVGKGAVQSQATTSHAAKVFDSRATGKATIKHQKAHPDKLVRNDFLVGSRNRILKKYESDKKKQTHIGKIKNDTKRRKKYPNQK